MSISAGLLQSAGAGEQRQVLVVLDQEALEHLAVEAVCLGQRVGGGLRRFEIEIEADRAESQVEIDQRHFAVVLLAQPPGDVVGDRGRAGAAAGADERDQARLLGVIGIGAHRQHRVDQMRGVGGQRDIFVHAALGELAISATSLPAHARMRSVPARQTSRQPVELVENRRVRDASGFDDQQFGAAFALRICAPPVSMLPAKIGRPHLWSGGGRRARFRGRSWRRRRGGEGVDFDSLNDTSSR